MKRHATGVRSDRRSVADAMLDVNTVDLRDRLPALGRPLLGVGTWYGMRTFTTRAAVDSTVRGSPPLELRAGGLGPALRDARRAGVDLGPGGRVPGGRDTGRVRGRSPPLNTVATRIPPPSRAYVVCQLLGWTTYALVGVIIGRMFMPASLPLALTTVAGCALAGLGTHALRGVILRRGWFRLRFAALAPRLIGAAFLVALAVEAGVTLIGLYGTGVYTWTSTTPTILFATTFNWTVTLVLWVAVYAGVRFFRDVRLAEIRRLESEVAAREAQLQSLGAQVHPHFLFNALNSLRALIAEDPDRARDLLTGLAELMRYALQAGQRERVPLAEELAAVEAYLRLEGARFEDRLVWTIDAPEAASAATLPPMLLQTLVENAVKHGVARRAEGGEVTVRACRDGNRLHLEVASPGHLGPRRDGAIGLANAERRLRLLYGDRARVSLSEDGAGRVVAEVVLPAEERP
jgi:hypothetical protein